ncbi:cytochrome C [Parasulfuritortus cantonensis]|uniref:Cytochrome C n=1 Tax=Parasulfuritortus cantonensis TaxID=2528202 RepID=A0A4R1B6D2_9PROT|nr:cytochrome c [Parasulfuritortus cantonensis]TCJ11788.1 cytochrome C [Parasulfuritortus cantonensis]
MKPIHLLIAVVLSAAAPAAGAEDVPADTREAVAMPPLQRALVREEMIQNLATLNDLLGLIAAGKLAEAADRAERELGFASMGKHAARTQGMGPGRFMPDAMRATGFAMHEAASEFAKVARQGDRAAAYAALQPVTEACVACHVGYRLK